MDMQKWKALIEKSLASNFQKLSMPYKILYVVTKECHSRCQNCKIWQVKPVNELSLSEVQQFAKNSPFLSWINLTGGETTDRPDLVDIIDAFREHCPDFMLLNFATNGLKPDHIQKVAKQIIDLRIPRFVMTVSIDGPPKVNDALRGIKGDFDSAVETYKRLSGMDGLDVYVGMTLYPNNFRLIDETVDEIKKRVSSFNYNRLHINTPHVSEHYFENLKKPPTLDPEFSVAIKRYMDQRGIPLTIFDLIERIYHQKSLEYLKTGKTPQVCSAGMSQVFISEHGDVYPCSIWSKKLGSLRESGYSLEPILKAALAREVRDKIKKKQCPNCWTPCEAYPTIAANGLSDPLVVPRAYLP